MIKEVTEVYSNVHRFKFDSDFRFSAMSDIHWDNPHCDRATLKRHLDFCLKNKIPFFVNGDFFCFMQGRYDPRRNKSDIRPEHNKANYVDAVINDAVDWFGKYKDIFAFVGYGNHEMSILKNLETDPLLRFVERFNSRYNANLQIGGYGGWILLNQIKSGRLTYKIKYHHGYGGGGPVTKGTIQHNRFSSFVQGANMIWMGHVHEDYELTYSIERLDQNNIPTHDDILMLRTSSYKEEYQDGSKGFHIERGRPVKPIGGRLVTISTAYKKVKFGKHFKAITSRML